MEPSLAQETGQLLRSWMQHEPAWLRDYLVAGVEDPRLNLQSILSRHFLIRSLCGARFEALMEQECRFSAVLAWLGMLAARPDPVETMEAVQHALARGADNAEGLELPSFVLQTHALLPARLGALEVPNYINHFLSESVPAAAREKPSGVIDTFQTLWSAALSSIAPLEPRPTVIEPACGSANDFRFLHSYGLARLLDYCGFDLCPKNIENARALFPAVRFETGNVFELPALDKSFDFCVVQDLFEHLSLAGMEIGVKEVCRVTRHGLCLGFFQMDEIPAHVVRPVDAYHCNLLSMERMRELFATHGFAAQVFHIATFLREQVGCCQTHNPNAYIFWLRPCPTTGQTFLQGKQDGQD